MSGEGGGVVHVSICMLTGYNSTETKNRSVVEMIILWFGKNGIVHKPLKCNFPTHTKITIKEISLSELVKFSKLASCCWRAFNCTVLLAIDGDLNTQRNTCVCKKTSTFFLQ